MRIQLLIVGGLMLGLLKPAVASANGSCLVKVRELPELQVPGGGGDDKEKKEKGGKKEKDDSMKDAKTRDISSKPQQHARYSAKTAKQTSRATQKQMMTRAKVRLFFHNTFNTKYGKPVNFRSTRARNRWSKGHRW